MSTDANRFWSRIASEVRRAQGLHPLTGEEADEEFESAPEHPLPGNKMVAMVEAVTSGRTGERQPTPDLGWLEDSMASEVEEELLQLARNPGQPDAETEELIRRLRREALNEGETDDEHKSDGMDGASAPP